MKIDTEQLGNSLTITLSDHQINVLMSVANAIRRTLLADIPVIGMQTIDITTNTMLLHHNQEITHKLSSIPVVSVTDSTTPLIATFDFKGSTSTTKTVFTSDDIKTPNGLKLHKGVPIVPMLPDEHLVGTITFGIGYASDNALKYSAITVPEYSVLQNKIVMTITPNSHYSSIELLNKCKELLINDIDTIYSGVTDTNEIVTINTVESDDSDTTLVQFFINGYDHTIGNMIATVINTELDVSFAGYCKPHPSNELIMVSLRSINPIDDFKKSLDIIKSLITQL